MTDTSTHYEAPLTVCRNCGEDFRRTRRDKVFCSDTCRYEFHGKRRARAMKLAKERGDFD